MEKVFTKKAPEAIGPYSQAIISGRYVFTSGQISPTGNITEQTEGAIRNLAHVLEAAGSSLGKVVKATVYLADMNDYPAMNIVYGKAFKNNPARSTVQVARLPKDAKVEIDCIAEI